MAGHNIKQMAEITLESLAAQLDEQKAVIEKQNDTIIELQSKIIAANVPEKPKELKIPASPVSFNDKQYKWQVASFCLPGSSLKITAEEASTDKAIIEKIIAIEGQGLLKEQA
jgi:hypothetical protein